MSTALHEQARTTPHARAQSAASDESVAVRARHNGVTAPTLYTWKRRTDVQDRLHSVHRLQTTLTRRREAPAEEADEAILFVARSGHPPGLRGPQARQARALLVDLSRTHPFRSK